MLVAERYYRKWNKIKPEAKLTGEQLKVVKIMHAFQKEYNKPKLPHGIILVNRKQLVEHLQNVRICLDETDKLMLNPVNKAFSMGDQGSKLAKIWNTLNLTLHSILHFQLNTPLEKLNDKIN